jgi:hypothetical protein
VGALSAAVLWRRFGLGFIAPLLGGALAYTVGSVLEYLSYRWLWVVPGVLGPHELFHLAVLVGAGCHWYFVWSFADGRVPARTACAKPPTPGTTPARHDAVCSGDQLARG